MIYLFYTIHVFICIFLILVVLLQQGKGADLSVFGGGGTMTAFGARGAATLLHKMTVFGFIAFIVTTLVIGILQKQVGNSSVMSVVPAAQEEAAAANSDEAEESEEAGAFAEAEKDILPEAESFDDPEGTDGSEVEDGNESESESESDQPADEAGGEGDKSGS